jgi:hypothetical protein
LFTDQTIADETGYLTREVRSIVVVAQEHIDQRCRENLRAALAFPFVESRAAVIAACRNPCGRTMTGGSSVLPNLSKIE